ncbi:NRDE family protein [Paraflavisolibacter sp. H34]|uniref:NRDE family protein n=1 Tax=Huijunlia imazamoxiresistens TaxID=3127457 RepID=UPI003017EF45
MCTVSFVPVNGKIFLTSNRDEQAGRQPALRPTTFSTAAGDRVFPKDPDAGGTWITLCSNGNAGVLLNGAFEKHRRRPAYQKSRGLVLLEILNGDRPVHNFSNISLEGVEPFTLVLWQKGELYECRWDEHGQKHCRRLPADRAHIWSSSTLYDEGVRAKREQWFRRWLQQQEAPTQTDVLDFHRFGGEGDERNDLYMNRDGQVYTVSITSLELGGNSGRMHYTDLRTELQSLHHLSFEETGPFCSN